MADRLWSDRQEDGGQPHEAHPGKQDEPWTTRERPQLMFRMFFKDGSRRAVQYFNIVQHEYQSGMVRIYCHECTITILGQRLQKLDDLLTEHKICTIIEQHISAFLAEGRTYIEKISLGPPNLETLGRLPV